MVTNNSINLNATGLAKYDGAGTFSGVTVTNHATLVGAASNGITSVLQGAGQVLIGTTASDPTSATLTAGTGVSITSASGAITINAVGGGIIWSVVTVNATFSVNTGTIANKAGTLAMALPAVSAVGDIISITGINTATGWQVTQASGQQIFFGISSTTSGATGTLTSSAIRDSLTMVCVVANTTWNVINSIGNITVA